MASPHALRRAIRFVIASFGLGVMLSVLPLPAMEFSTVSVGHSNFLPVVTDASASTLNSATAEAGVPLAGSRVGAGDTSTESFSSIGLTFNERPVAPVLIRTKLPNGQWDPWQRVDVSSDDGPDGQPTSGTDPMWVGDAVGYEVNLGATDADGTKVVTVEDELKRATVDATPLAGAALASAPVTIRPRTAWSARAPRSTAYADSVKMAVVHHSASGNSYTPAQVPAVLRSVQAFHMDGRGWSDIGYNIVIDKFGSVWEGRAGGLSRAVVGTHAMGFNTGSFGVMVLGDFSKPGIVPSAAVLESVSRVIGWKMALNRIDPSGHAAVTSGGSSSIPAGKVVDLPRVVAHRDIGATGCPGSIYASMAKIRARAQQWTSWIRNTTEAVGVLEAVTVNPGSVTVKGFANDPDVKGGAKLTLAVGALRMDGITSIPRPDVVAQNRYRLFRADSGFSLTLSGINAGFQRMCLTLVDQGVGAGDTTLECRDIRVSDPLGNAPTGGLAAVTGGPALVRVAGRVADRQASGSMSADVLIDGASSATFTSNGSGLISGTVPAIAGGTHNVCLQVRNVGLGANTVVDCRSVVVASTPPRGAVENLAVLPTAIRVKGWAVDDESKSPVTVVVSVDGKVTSVVAALARPDKLALFPALGAQHGFDATIPATKGSHSVCVTAKSIGGSANTKLACSTLIVK